MRGDERRFGFDAARGADYTPEQLRFLRAIDRWRCTRHRACPTMAEVFALVFAMGYRCVAEPTALPVFRGR